MSFQISYKQNKVYVGLVIEEVRLLYEKLLNTKLQTKLVVATAHDDKFLLENHLDQFKVFWYLISAYVIGSS